MRFFAVFGFIRRESLGSILRPLPSVCQDSKLLVRDSCSFVRSNGRPLEIHWVAKGRLALRKGEGEGEGLFKVTPH